MHACIVIIGNYVYTYIGRIARDQMKNEGVEDLTSMQDNREESRVRLERYDMVIIYM